MRQPTITHRRLARGIYRDRYGFRACVRVRGVLRSKRFPLHTPMAMMKAWRLKARELLPPAPPPHPLPPVSCPSWDAPARQCYVYFIRDGDALKIGRARNVHERLGGLQVAHHAALVLVGCLVADAATERAIHQQFRPLWIRGEWFRLDAALMRFVAQLPPPDMRPPDRITNPRLRRLNAVLARMEQDALAEDDLTDDDPAPD